MKTYKGLLQAFNAELRYAIIDKLIVHGSERASFVSKDRSENDWCGSEC
ncbi:MAG: hypothetical protein PHI98_10760 [Eubacteriales bacterium]|nr:hypothetical protein [Eubacteriales bacterium]